MIARWLVAAQVGGPFDRETIRRTAEDVFSGPEYRRDLSWWERFTRWLAERFRLPEAGPGAGAAAGMSNLVLWVVMFVLVAAVVVLVVMAVRRWTPRTRSDGEDLEVDVTEERTVREWRDDAERAEADGRWKDAIRARFRELVGELVERGVLDRAPGRTTGEFRAEIAERAPDAAAAFSRAALRFELPWYGNVPCDERDLAELRAAGAEALAVATKASTRADHSADELVEVS